MRIRETMDLPDGATEPLPGAWGAWSDGHLLHETAASWDACPAFQKDPQRNRRFLATFAVYLVQQFMSEEGRLKRDKSPTLASCRRENRRLALQLRDLMSEADRGLEVTSGIRAFLRAWRFHQERMPLRSAATEAQGH